jgi:hypothetical protein
MARRLLQSLSRNLVEGTNNMLRRETHESCIKQMSGGGGERDYFSHREYWQNFRSKLCKVGVVWVVCVNVCGVRKKD